MNYSGVKPFLPQLLILPVLNQSGQQWLNKYIGVLHDDQKLQVKRKTSDRFSNLEMVRSNLNNKLPSQQTETDLMESKLPLLVRIP